MAVNVVIKNVQFKTGAPYRTDKLIINPHCPLIDFLSFRWWRTDYKDALAQSFLLPVLVEFWRFFGKLHCSGLFLWSLVWFSLVECIGTLVLSPFAFICYLSYFSSVSLCFCFFFPFKTSVCLFFYLHRPSDFALSSCDWKQQQYFSTKQIKLTNLKGFFLIMSNIIYPVFCPMWFLFSQNMQIKDINFCFQITREIFLYFLMC